MNGRRFSIYRVILAAIFWLGILNFAALWVISSAFGSAWHGKVENGHYYLGKHANGPFLEVTPEIFTLSLWHVRSVFITHTLAILAALLFNYSEKGSHDCR